MASEGGQRVTLSQLDVQQLLGAKRNIEAEVQRFAESLQFFNKSGTIYVQANEAIRSLNEAKEGQGLLLPLTQSLYVSGEVASVEQVLVDIGTNYYVEMTTEQAQDYLKRKLDKLAANVNDVQQVLRIKQNQLMAVERELSTRQAVGATPVPA